MPVRILIPLHEDDVAPRFDLATDVLIVASSDIVEPKEHRVVVLPRASADQICHLAMTEKVQVVICGGIEDTYYRYLVWKGIEVIDSVIGHYQSALNQYIRGTLQPGTILH
jgi:predicted Fe-Mo cluster-binding NifX family protein